MAISWDIKLTNVNLVSKRADVTATRTDDQTQVVETYSFSQVILDSAEDWSDLWDTIWGKHEVAATKQAAIDTMIGTKLQSGKADLEAREV